MNAVNYDKKMMEIISKNKTNTVKPTLLLHACCAPCFCGCYEKLISDFDLTVYFYNPNIDTDKEYDLRLLELKKVCENLGIKLICEGHEKQDFLNVAKGLHDSVEGGARCRECFTLRLDKTAKKAKQLNFNYFATTLTVSPLKNASLINSIGEQVGDSNLVCYLVSDFKKRGGYQRSVELSKEFNLYRQSYCGCEFSK